MTVGAFGELIFQVSAHKILTFGSLSVQTEARWTEHERHLQNPLPEYQGNQNDKITVPVYLSAFAGTNPAEEIGKIRSMIKTGSPHYLVIGTTAYGNVRWVIQKAKIDMQRYDNEGDLLEATVSLTLLEYPER